MNVEELKKLHTNQRLLVLEMQRRGIDVRLISWELELLEARYGQHKEYLLDRDSSLTPYPASIIAGNKSLAKQVLEEGGISVPRGFILTSDKKRNLSGSLAKLNPPFVGKPNFGSHGDCVYTGLENRLEVEEAIERIGDLNGKENNILIEEQFQGEEYRIFITKEGKYAVLHRDPAHVVGDGKKKIEELAKEETERRMHPRTTCLCPVLIDSTVVRYFKKQGINLDYIPPKNEKVYLRKNSNIATGGMCTDVTEMVHASVLTIAKHTLSLFPGLPYAGLDFMTKDISQEQTQGSYNILEVNTVPGIAMHMLPGRGKPRAVASYIADLIFPETK